jgi:hypothetical protein
MRGLPTTFRCGDRVRSPVDRRHEGVIVLIDSGIWAMVQWEGRQVYEHVKLDKLEKVDP